MATARANSNIAFIKYWGNTDDTLRLPANSSLSMNLDGLYTETSVTWDDAATSDTLTLNGEPTKGAALERVVTHLNMLRNRLDIQAHARVESRNTFPMGAGIASSASAFAALTVAAVGAAEATLSERELSILARLGSGSASRSVPSGFVEWHVGTSHDASYAESFAAPDHWNLVDVIAIVSDEHKAVGSTRGHASAQTGDLQSGRLANVNQRLVAVKQAILKRDFATFAEVVEEDSNLMHSVMMTSRPPLFYWLPATLSVMNTVRTLRAEGANVCYTLDAGPNVHCICTADVADAVAEKVRTVDGVVDVLRATPGGPATLV